MTIQVDKVLEDVLPQTTWYIVLRPFGGDDHALIAGEIVDTASWRHVKSLVERRYIKPLPHGVSLPEPTVGDDGISRRLLTSVEKVGEDAKRPTPTRKKA